MNPTRFAIVNNRVTAMLLVAVLAGGASAYTTMEQAMDPGFTIRAAQIVTRFPGASPERVEALVTDPIETAIQKLPELDFVTSTSTTGLSIVAANIRDEFTEVRPIWDSLRRKIDDVARTLPQGVRPPEVNDEFGDVFGTLVAVTGDGFGYRELKDFARQFRDSLLRLDNVGNAEIWGAQEERVFIEYNDARLAELGLSVHQVGQILQARNILTSGGSLLAGDERLELEPTGNFNAVEELGRTVISAPGRPGLLYLEDIAEITRGYVDPPRGKVRVNGQPALLLAISVREGGNVVELGEEVEALLARVSHQYPLGIEFDIVAFEPERVAKKVDQFAESVLQAVAIVLLSMLLMLGLRTGLVVASLVPSVLLMSLLVMQWMGLGLNQMTLAALIISLGLLVDNAIVMSESIMVSMSGGKPPVEAAVASAVELRTPLLTSSLTTSAAFLPIYLAEGTTGEYTGVLFVVVTIALLCSWLLALTVTPLLCTRFLKARPAQSAHAFDSRFYRSYRAVLLRLVRFPLISLGVVLGIFSCAMMGLGLVPNIFFPPDDTPVMTARFEAPIGTSIEKTEQLVADLDGFIASELVSAESRPEGVVNWSAYVGLGPPRFTLSYAPSPSSPEFASVLFNLTTAKVIPEFARRIEQFCAEHYPSVIPTVGPLALGSVTENPVEVRVSGADRDRVFTLVDSIKAHIYSIRGTKNINDDWGQQTKKLTVAVDEARARRSGITHQDVAMSLQSVLNGYRATEYREGTELIPVTIRSIAANRQDVSKVEALNVYSQSKGTSVPLMQVADLAIEWQPARLLRRNRLTTVTISSELTEGVTALDITLPLEEWLDKEQASWPPGYFYEFGGELENSSKSQSALRSKLPYGGLFILALLVAQFNSVRRTLIILFTIPLALVGVVIGLLITQSYWGFMTLLGMLSLAGIVINNAIVLIDRIGIEVRNGLAPPQAVIEAAQRRLRPILLTTVTTVGGLIPLWLGGGPMWESMAIAIIFGLIFATLLTLGVVPVLYALLFRVRFKGFQYKAAGTSGGVRGSDRSVDPP